MQYNTEGLIYNIQRYSLHDGPGIRTIIFLKGCPLRCPWCANPESQSSQIEKMGDEVVGKTITVEEAIDIVKRDMPFYKRSGGGMTLSGGEPLAQPKFAKALVKEAKASGINVAVETCGYQKWDLLWEVLEDVDTILFDIKGFNSDLHKEVIGVDNHLILDNIKKLSSLNKNIVVRVPIIPEYNDSYEELNEIANFCASIGIKEINLLPYHQLGVHKYEKLNREYSLKDIRDLDREKLEKDRRKLELKHGINITI